MANIGWGQGTWGNNKWGGQLDVSFSVTGFEATTSLGDEGIFIQNVAEPTGVSATATLGFDPTTDLIIPVTFSVTGVSATAGFLSGWGSSAWDSGVWGGGVFADVGQIIVPTGQSAQTLVQSVTIISSVTFSVTGVQASGDVGDEDTVPQNKVSVTLPALTGSIGSSTLTGTGTFSLTGTSTSLLLSGYSDSTITFTVTVVSGNPSNHPYHNFGSTNKYAINGSTATSDVTLELFEGNTYRFDQSDSSNSGHPIAFSETANGTHGGGTAYTLTEGVTTSGTAGQAGAYTEIVISENTPTLYYYCQNHSGMGWTANTPIVFRVATTTGAPTTGNVGTTALGDETVIGGADVGVTLAGLSISVGALAISGTSVLSLTGVSGTGATGEEQVYGIIRPDQLANWIERVA
tara:strand:- start:450 stop:1664 length:1215 start_codon:yes stop_codon:yes gene_type:complete